MGPAPTLPLVLGWSCLSRGDTEHLCPRGLGGLKSRFCCIPSVSLLAPQIAMPHQWLEGNLPVSAKCTVCDKTCGSVLRLQDWRCLWCKAMVSGCEAACVPPGVWRGEGNWEWLRGSSLLGAGRAGGHPRRDGYRCLQWEGGSGPGLPSAHMSSAGPSGRGRDATPAFPWPGHCLCG